MEHHRHTATHKAEEPPVQAARSNLVPSTGSGSASVGIPGQLDSPSPTRQSDAPRMRKSPPRLELNGISGRDTGVVEPAPVPLNARQPSLVVEPASPAERQYASTSPYPPPIPSTSTSSPTPPVSLSSSSSSSSYAGSFIPPPTAQAQQSGGLAARRAAKLGKKRLSLLVPANPHSSVPVPAPASAGVDQSGQTLLSPLTPSFLLPSSLKTSLNGTTKPNGAAYDAEIRSLPPSPLSLTTFIGPEGAEAPDRTIGRLMLKQQADEMREQMRGQRGMKRRTSIPRLNLVKTGAAQAHPANLDSIASATSLNSPAMSLSGSASSHLSRALSSGATGAPTASAVQFIRSSENSLNDDAATGGGPVEEFPYALGPREILPGVFLGSEQNAKDAQVLRDWRIRFVLNVAKEVDCPWTEEADALIADGVIDHSSVHTASTPAESTSTPLAEPQIRTPSAGARPVPPPGPRRAQSHAPESTTILSASPERMPSPSGNVLTASPIPVRPTFIRPTASTPNLHASFDPLASPPPPPLPPLPDLRDLGSVYPSLAESAQKPDAPLPTPSTARHSFVTGRRATYPTVSTCRSPDAMRIPPNPTSGRPELEYLWLKWGHDESDLVEAKKFQAAFDFLDEARERDERVLVHCQCGVSRSATVVIAYCMREAARALEEGREATELAGCTGMHDTYSFVKEKSEWVGPNLSLVFQLVAYERTLRGDSINGDDDLSEPPSAAFRSETRSTFPDLPLPTPVEAERPVSFPPPASARSLSRLVNGALVSPHTPVSDASLALSQMSTPDLHDPLYSPALSVGTRASSVTSTPLSPERHGHSRPTIRIVNGDADDDGRHRVQSRSVEDVLDSQAARKADSPGQKSLYILPVPPRGNYPTSEVLSPTIAQYPSQALPNGPPLSIITDSQPVRRAPPTLSLDMSAAANASHPGVPSLAPVVIQSSSTGPTAATGQPLRVTTDELPSAFSPDSITSSSRSGSMSSISKTPLSAYSQTADSSLVRSHSGRRFGAGQTRSERRASHRRVCSDTIRVPTTLGFTSASSPITPLSGVNGSASPRSSTPRSEVTRADEQERSGTLP